MCDKEFYDVIDLLSCCLFHECNELGAINLKQVHTLINILVKANIPFNVSFNQGTRTEVQNFVFQIIISPTSTITKLFQLHEGAVSIT